MEDKELLMNNHRKTAQLFMQLFQTAVRSTPLEGEQRGSSEDCINQIAATIFSMHFDYSTTLRMLKLHIQLVYFDDEDGQNAIERYAIIVRNINILKSIVRQVTQASKNNLKIYTKEFNLNAKNKMKVEKIDVLLKTLSMIMNVLPKDFKRDALNALANDRVSEALNYILKEAREFE